MNRYILLLLGAALALCLDGLYAAPGAATKPIRVIDTGSRALSDLRLSRDGKQLFFFAESVAVRIDWSEGVKVEKHPFRQKLRIEWIRPPFAHVEGDVWFLRISRSPYQTEADGYKCRFVLYDFAAEKIQADWPAHKGGAGAMAFDAKRDRLITAGMMWEDRTVCYWDRKTLKKVAEFDVVEELGLKDDPASPYRISSVALDPTASHLAFGINRLTIQVRDVAKNEWRVAYRQREMYLLESLFFLDERTLAAGWINLRGSGFIELYDWKAGKVLFRVSLRGSLATAAASPDGKLLAVGDDNSSGLFFRGCHVRLWDVQAKREIAVFPAYEKGIDKMTFSPGGKRLVANGDSGIVKIWDVESIVNPPKP